MWGYQDRAITEWQDRASINKKKRGAVSVQIKWGIQILGIHVNFTGWIRKPLVVFKSDTSFGPEIKLWVPRKALASQLCPVDIGLSSGSINQHTPSYCNLCLSPPQMCVWPNRITLIKVIVKTISQISCSYTLQFSVKHVLNLRKHEIMALACSHVKIQYACQTDRSLAVNWLISNDNGERLVLLHFIAVLIWCQSNSFVIPVGYDAALESSSKCRNKKLINKHANAWIYFLKWIQKYLSAVMHAFTFYTLTKNDLGSTVKQFPLVYFTNSYKKMSIHM